VPSVWRQVRSCAPPICAPLVLQSPLRGPLQKKAGRPGAASKDDTGVAASFILSDVRFTPESGPGEKGEPRPELNEHCRNGHGKEFYFVPTHSLMKRARSFISIFCCSARLVHSRIFCAFSCGIIFSGAVAFNGPGNCADAAWANNATPKDSA
jgi:hypothetical protein